jgi:hypothetical protein
MIEALRSEMESLQLIFTESRRILGEGKLIDLRGLDQRIRKLCDQIEGLEQAQRQGLLQEFTTLLTQLEALESDLRAARDRA